MRLHGLAVAALLLTSCSAPCRPQAADAPLPCPTVVLVPQVFLELHVLEVPEGLLAAQPALASVAPGGQVVLPFADAQRVLAGLRADTRTTTVALPAMIVAGGEEGVLEVVERGPNGASSGLLAQVIPTVPGAGPDVTLDVEVSYRVGRPTPNPLPTRVIARGVKGGVGLLALLVEPARAGSTTRLVVSVDARVLEPSSTP
jgi:hypothetical protein